VSKLLFIQNLIDTVVCGDAVEKLSELPDKSVDADVAYVYGHRYFGVDNVFDYVGYGVKLLKGIAFGDKDVTAVRSRASSL